MKKLGNINPHTLAIVMKECVRRAIIAIQAERITFTSKAKDVMYKDEEDLVTSADLAAQEIYVRVLTENYPKAGIIAEEDFARKCTDKNHNYYFTIDPLDGTKAFGRRSSTGVSTMLSFIFDGEVIAITIGDVNTSEIFHTRPESLKIHRIYGYEKDITLAISPERLLRDQYLQLRCDARELSKFGQLISHPTSEHRLFKKAQVEGGSIGVTFSRLWKGEVGGVFLEPGTGYQTPWDSCPVMGISQKMGIKFFLISDKTIHPYIFEPQEENIYIGQEMLCIHENRVNELAEWCAINGFDLRMTNSLNQSYINKVLAYGVDTFGSDEKFKRWLNEPLPAHSVAPIFYPYPEIENLLGRIDHGIY